MAEKNDKQVIVQTPSRIHISLIDLHCGLGRIDGGLGVALQSPCWQIKVSTSNRDSAPSEVRDVLQMLSRKVRIKGRYRAEIKSRIPRHVGFGSQTQLSLAIAKCLAILEDWKFDIGIRNLATLVGRGGTSGIGVAAFEKGGFIIDCGHSLKMKKNFAPSHFSQAPPPPVVFRENVPVDWFFLTATPSCNRKIAGDIELNMFKRFCPIPKREVEKLTRLILMKTVPSIVERDIELFGESISETQKIGFKRLENSVQPKTVKELLKFLDKNSLGAGLSSFGPTVYAIFGRRDEAEEGLHLAEEFFKERGLKGRVKCTTARNMGASINYHGLKLRA